LEWSRSGKRSVFLAERLLVTNFFGMGAVSLNRSAMIDQKTGCVFPDGGSCETFNFQGPVSAKRVPTAN
jgi:hypothetical protein